MLSFYIHHFIKRKGGVKVKHFIAIIIGVMILGGCGPQAETIQPLQVGNQAIVAQEKADEAKQILLSMEEVLEVKGVVNKQGIYLAPRVKHFDRFHLNDIRKRGHENVAKRFPKETVHVSTDKKIYMELEKLEQELKKKTISEKRFSTKLKELEEKMKG
jgi:hypothetical protein